MKRKGFTTIIIVFIVMSIALVGITWYQVQRTSGPSQQKELIQETELDGLENSLYNVKRLLRRLISFSGYRSTQKVSDDSGRESNSYWVCRNNSQIPEKDVLHEELNKNFLRYYSRGALSLRDNIGFQITGVDNVDDEDVEFRELEKFEEVDPGNDRFNISLSLDKIRLKDDDNIRNIEDITLNETIRHNRFWFMYDALSNFVEENKDYMYQKSVYELRQVEDTYIKRDYMTKTRFIWMYPWIYQECMEKGKGPVDIKKEHFNILQEKADKTMANITRILEKRYFQNQATCSYSPNSFGSSESYYPGIQIRSYDGYPLSPEVEKTCWEPSEWVCEFFGVPGTACKLCTFTCSKFPKYLKFDVLFDYNIECRDTRYSNIISENDELEPLTWNFDISFTSKDHKWDQIEYDFEGDNERGPSAGRVNPATLGPQIHNTCSLSGDASVGDGEETDEDGEEEWCNEGETSTETDFENYGNIDMETVGKFEQGSRDICMFRDTGDGTTVLNRTQYNDYVKMVKKDSSGQKTYEYTQDGTDSVEKNYEDGEMISERREEGDSVITTEYYPDTDGESIKRKQDMEGNSLTIWEYFENGSIKPGYPETQDLSGGL